MQKAFGGLSKAILMSISPAASFTLGNSKYDSHASAVQATLGAAVRESLSRDASSKGEIGCGCGRSCIAELDGGEGSRRSTGKIAWLRRGIVDTQVVASDGGFELSAMRPAATYQQQSGKDVVRAMASDAGADVGSSISIYRWPPMSPANDAPLLSTSRLLIRTARSASFGGDGKLSVVAASTGTPDLALLYGREILEVHVRERAAPKVKRFRIGGGPAGSSSAPDALRYSLSALPGGADDPGPNAVWEPAAILRIPDAASGASTAADALRCFSVADPNLPLLFTAEVTPRHSDRDPGVAKWIVKRALAVDQGGSPLVRCSRRFNHIRGTKCEWGWFLGALLGAIGGLL